MANPNGNLLGMGKGSKNQIKKQRRSHRGHYKLGFVEPFVGVSERDVELRKDYGKDLIGRFVGYPKDLIKFRKKSSEQTIVSLDEVYYVKVGKETIGKLSIRVQRLFTSINITFIYQEKKLSDGSTKTRKANGKPKSKSPKRDNRRKRTKDNRTL